jgi:putative tryptophan/tyrosine transport system substrate-binding protein
MKRREVIALVGGAAAWPLAARAQQPAMPAIGVLNGAPTQDSEAMRLGPFQQGLSEAGYVEGRNVVIVYRSAEGRYDRLPMLAADLVRRQVAVIAAIGGIAPVLAAKAATTRIPIVFYSSADPVALGLVVSLSQPTGNLTGVTSLGVEVGPKRLELLRELVPTTTNVALLVNPTNANAEILESDLQAATRTLGLQLHVLRAGTEHEFEKVFASLVQLRVGALVIGPDALFNDRSAELAALSLRHRVAAIYQYREFVAAGGLMSYGGSAKDSYRLVGLYTGRILKGEKPPDLPVQQSSKVELLINLKTAKALSLAVPPTLLGRADEVIE